MEVVPLFAKTDCHATEHRIRVNCPCVALALCVSPVQSELFYHFHPLASGFWMNYSWCVIYIDVSVRQLLPSLNSMFPPPSRRFKAKRCFGCIGAKEKGTWSTLPCKDTFVANVTFNTKWQLNARFGFLTKIECLEYEFKFERLHGIKYNKLSEGKEQEIRGEKVLLKHIQTWHFLMSITIKGFASPSIKTRMPPVNQRESHNNTSRKNETKNVFFLWKSIGCSFCCW